MFIPLSVVGYLAITFVYYWWHRWRNEIGFLWRFVHQVHHPPQRIEIITSSSGSPRRYMPDCGAPTIDATSSAPSWLTGR